MHRTTGARPGFVFFYALAYAALWVALLTPVLVTLALKIQALAPARAAQQISIVFAIGALVALVSNPLFGALSDRTTSRLGRRRPWLIGGILGGALSLAIIGAAPNLSIVLIGWCLAQVAFNATLAALVAVLPDQVPIEQRGTVSGILGICQPIGMIAGTFLVQMLAGSLLPALVVPGLVGAVGVLLFAITMSDPPVAAPTRAERVDFLDRYLIKPRRHPDFVWAWISRVLFVVGSCTLQTYQPLYLMDRLGLVIHEVPPLIFASTLVGSTTIVIASTLAGRLSDRLKRRKAFVFAGAVTYALGLLFIATAGSVELFLTGIAIAGLGQGIYVGVDLALFTDVLPHQQRDAAKDLGLVNVTNTLPQILAPAISPLILSTHGDSYAALFFAAAGLCVLGALAILPLKSIR
jgi:MFS family permease